MEIADDFDALQKIEYVFYKRKCGHTDCFTAYRDWDKFPCDCTGQIVICPYHTYISEKKAELEATICAQCAGEEHG